MYIQHLLVIPLQKTEGVGWGRRIEFYFKLKLQFVQKKAGVRELIKIKMKIEVGKEQNMEEKSKQKLATIKYILITR